MGPAGSTPTVSEMKITQVHGSPVQPRVNEVSPEAQASSSEGNILRVGQHEAVGKSVVDDRGV